MRTLGAVVVLLAAVIYLGKERSRTQKENAMAADILAALESLETSIRWEKCPLPTGIQKQENRKYAGIYFREIHRNLESNTTLQAAWENVFSRMKPPQLAEILCGISLSGDSTYLEDSFSCAAREIRDFQSREREKQTAGRKVKTAAALSAAAVIIIVLL